MHVCKHLHKVTCHTHRIVPPQTQDKGTDTGTDTSSHTDSDTQRGTGTHKHRVRAQCRQTHTHTEFARNGKKSVALLNHVHPAHQDLGARRRIKGIQVDVEPPQTQPVALQKCSKVRPGVIAYSALLHITMYCRLRFPPIIYTYSCASQYRQYLFAGASFFF